MRPDPSPAIVLALVMAVLAPAAAGAAEPEPHEREYLLRYRNDRPFGKYGEWLLKDGVNLVTRPHFWTAENWKRFGLGASATVGSFALDDGVRTFVEDHPGATPTRFLEHVENHFAPGNLGVYSLALFAAGAAAHREKVADTGFLALESIFYAERVSGALKSLTHRERPRSADGPFEFHGPGGSTIENTSSFISGHTIGSFAFAASVSEVWKRRWVTVSSYGVASLIGLQRIDSGAHWLSDVVGAALAGRAIGKRIVRFHYEREPRKRRVEVTPVVVPEGVGLRFEWR